MKAALADHVDLVLTSVAFVSSSATTQSVFIGSVISVMGLSLLLWLNGYPQKKGNEIICFAGPYRFVRYPMVLSRCLILVGLLLASRQPLLYCLAVLVMTPLYHRLSRTEDESMEREFGPVASEYRALVSGLIPQLLPAKILGVPGRGVREHFSWRRALRANGWEVARVCVLVFCFLLGHYIWVLRMFTDLQWRLGAIGFTALALAWYLGAVNRRASLLAG
jgi:protein-S-isoprenylcysteine O-methyltransferase Ste14